MTSLKYKEKRHLPLPKGPYTVGCTDIMTGNSINGIFLRLYYPSSENGILENFERWPLWAPNKHYISGYASYSFFQSFAYKVWDKTCGDVYIPAIFDAIPLINEKPYPLVMYSHGLFSCRTSSSTTHVELASNGYVVAALEHRDGSACYTYYIKNKMPTTRNVPEIKDNNRDAKYYFQKKMSNGNDVEKIHMPILLKSFSSKYAVIRNKQLHQRSEECIRALDFLRDMNEGNAPRNVLDTCCELTRFKGLFDMSKVALAGHSMGGASALLSLTKDRRFKVGLGLDIPTTFLEMEQVPPSRLTQPMLFIKSSNFYGGKNKLEILNKFQSDETERQYATICGTTHLSQCDTPFMIPNVMNVFAWGRIKGDVFTHSDIHNKLMMNFLNKHLDLPVNEEHENYIISKSSLIKFGTDIADERSQFIYAAFMLTCVFVTLLTTFIYRLL